MGDDISQGRGKSRASRSVTSHSIQHGVETDDKTSMKSHNDAEADWDARSQYVSPKLTNNDDKDHFGSKASLNSTSTARVTKAESENFGSKATLVSQKSAAKPTATEEKETDTFDPKTSPKLKKNVSNLKSQHKSRKPPSKQATATSDDFNMDSYKARGNLSSRQTRTSVLGQYPDSKQSTVENMVKASYKLTEDILDPDKSNEPWVNSARENQAGQVVCSTHNGANVIMHCRTCDRLVCDECITTIHKPHDLFEIWKQGLQDKIILREKLPDVRDRALPSLKKNVETLANTKDTCSEEFDKMVDQIKQRSAVLVNSIERARDRLINRCISDKAASHSFLTKLEDKLSTGVIAVEAAANSSEDALKLDRDPAIVHERIKIQWLLDKYRRSHPYLVYPKFQNGSAAREDAALEKMVGYFEGMLRCEAKDQLHKIMLNVTPLGSLKPSYLKTLPYKHKIRTACPAGDDKICIIPVIPKTVFEIMTSDGVSVLTEVDKVKKIYDITRTMDSHFLVSDPESRKVMRVSQAGVIVKWTNTNGIPRGIHACKNGDILVCVVDSVDFNYTPRTHKRRHIVRMNENFKILETYGERDELFTIPDRVFENINGDICVIDRIGGLDSRLVVLDCHGGVRFQFPGEGSFDGTYGDDYIPLKRPAFSDVCCDGYSNIYLSDERNGEMVVLDQDGVQQKNVEEIFAKKRDKVETNVVSPQRVVVDQNGKIWIIQRRKITLFALYN